MTNNAKVHKVPKYGQRYARYKVDEVVSALILNPRVQDVSEATGISYATIHRWLKEESFKEKLALAKRELFEDGYVVLRLEFKKSVLALVAMRDNPNVSDAVRLGAMRTLMEYGKQVDMMDHYDGKLEQLEARTINAVDSNVTVEVPETTNDSWTERTPDWKDQQQPQDWQQ